MRIINVKITKENNVWLEFDKLNYRLIDTSKIDIFKNLSNQDSTNVTIDYGKKVVNFGNKIRINFRELYELSIDVDEVLKHSSKRKMKFATPTQITHLSEDTISASTRKLRTQHQKFLDHLNGRG